MSPRIAAAVLCLVAASAGAQPPPEARSRLSLVWCDPAGIAWGTELVARSEAADLLTRVVGTSVSWRRGTAGEVNDRDGIWVILVDSGPKQPAGSLVLGATRAHRTDSRVLWVRVPNVVAAVGASQSRRVHQLPPEDLRMVGVALGRVIAHEVVHVLAPTLPHGSGLMSGSLTRAQLTAGSIAVGHEVTLAVRAALRGEPAFAPPAVAMMAQAPQLMEKDY